MLYRKLDSGAFADVFRTTLSKTVAVKRFRDVRQQDQMDAVLSESRILQALDHPAVPQVLGIVPSVPELSIVMTLMPGKPLDRVIHPSPPSSFAPAPLPLPLSDVLRVALCLADVLEYVHSAGIIHRDLKPANVLQCDSGCVYLVDFGFAVASDASLAGRGVSTAKTVGFQGTPLYSAPETFDAVPQVTCDS